MTKTNLGFPHQPGEAPVDDVVDAEVEESRTESEVKPAPKKKPTKPKKADA